MNTKTPTFEQAIHASITICKAWESGEVSDEVLSDQVGELIKTPDGARGFFVIGLASDFTLLDRLPDTLVLRLRAAGEKIVDLTVKNLAMSTAMVIHHERQSEENQKSKSERIKERCIELLRLLETNAVKNRIEKLLKGTIGESEDELFLDKWSYDKEQREAIASSASAVAQN